MFVDVVALCRDNVATEAVMTRGQVVMELG